MSNNKIVNARRIACYHARSGFPGNRAPRFGQRVTVLKSAERGVHPRNVLIEFDDGHRTVTSVGCLRWKCDHRRSGTKIGPGENPGKRI